MVDQPSKAPCLIDTKRNNRAQADCLECKLLLRKFSFVLCLPILKINHSTIVAELIHYLLERRLWKYHMDRVMESCIH